MLKEGIIGEHWEIILDGFPNDRGFVYTKDGEIIGNYACDDNDICSFTPDGATASLFTEVHVGLFCTRITEWFRAGSA